MTSISICAIARTALSSSDCAFCAERRTSWVHNLQRKKGGQNCKWTANRSIRPDLQLVTKFA